jgi:hypothetical protein
VIGTFRRLAVGPDEFHEADDRHDLVAAQRQCGEDATLGRPAECDRLAVDGLNRAEHTDLHPDPRPFDVDTIHNAVRNLFAALNCLLNGEMPA